MENRKKVLIIEDDEALQRIFKRQLEKFGLIIIPVLRSRDVRAALDAHLDADLVMLDQDLDERPAGTDWLPLILARGLQVMAISNSDLMRMAMRDIGCQYESPKLEAAKLAAEILGYQNDSSAAE